MGVIGNMLLVFSGIPLGFIFWYIMVARQVGDWMHLRNFWDRLNFFFMPFPPKNVIAILWPNGNVDVHVDAEVNSDSGGYTIRIPGGLLWTPKLPWKTLSLIETGVVPRVPTPYALTWRVLAGWMFAWIWGYYALIMPAETISLTAPEFFMPITTLVALVIYIFTIFKSVITPNVPTTMLVVRSIIGNVMHAEPAEGPLGVSPIEKARLRGEKIVIKVPENAERIFNEIRRMLRVPPDAAAEILAKLNLFAVYRKSLTGMQAHYKPLHEIAKAYVQMNVVRITVGRAILIAVIAGIAFLAGWALGGGAIVIAPAPVEQAQAVQPYQPGVGANPYTQAPQAPPQPSPAPAPSPTPPPTPAPQPMPTPQPVGGG